MDGFFNRSEVSKAENPYLSCINCGLYKDCRTPKMDAYGDFEKEIMIIGEAPGEKEDLRGKPFQGKSGRLLKRTLRNFGIDLYRDCITINSINCRPPDNRNPTKNEIDCCRKEKVKPAIDQYKPRLIILLGSVPIESIIGDRWKKELGSIQKWRGWTIPDKDYKCWIVTTYHPSYILRRDSKEIITVWKNDLKLAFSMLKKDLPIFKPPEFEVMEDLRFFRRIKKGLVVLDYETTGKKPHKQGHQIVSGAVAINPDFAYTFLMPQTLRGQKHFIKFIQDPNIQKIAANLKFEENWSAVALTKKGLGVINWAWDTMIAAHLLDNRPGISGLKFQVYVNFGVIDYDSEVSNYITSKEDSANGFNRFLELIKTQKGRELLLKYNALDVIWEYRLAELQMKQIKWDFIYV